MKSIIKLFILLIPVFIISSCNTNLQGYSSNLNNSSPFIQLQNLKKSDIGYDCKQIDQLLQSYGIYTKVLEKITEEVYYDSICNDAEISGYKIGDKNIAILMISKGHLYIFVMFSNNNGKWTADGIGFHRERNKPRYRVEQSYDGIRYWLVVKHETNHGTGLSIYNETWYNPDGSIAADYPAEGSTLFFPSNITPDVYTNFYTSAYYNGDSRISLSYSISFAYSYKDIASGHGSYEFRSEYRPVILYNWEYDLDTKQLKFKSCHPPMKEGFSTMKHATSDEYGILQGYIDFYRMRLGDKKISTLEEWEKFMSEF